MQISIVYYLAQSHIYMYIYRERARERAQIYIYMQAESRYQKRLNSVLAGFQHLLLSALLSCEIENSMLILDLEVFIKGIFSGHFVPENKKVFFFLMKIMFAALKTLANTAICIILRRNRRPAESLRQSWGIFFPWMHDSDDDHRHGKTF